jgi:hypothetical protein
MTIPKKGSRRIVVDGLEYRWSFVGSLVIESLERRGSILWVVLPRFFPASNEGQFDRPWVPIVPGEVAQYVRLALQTGWKPSVAGSAFRLGPEIGGSIHYADLFSLSFRMIGDVMLAHVLCREASLTMSVWDRTDASGDLMNAVLSLLQSSDKDTDTATCRWLDTPGEWRWVLSRKEERVEIKVLRFEDTYSPLPDEKGVQVFRAKTTLMRLAIQVQGQMQRFLDRFGERGYQVQWGHLFPLQSFHRLERTIQELAPAHSPKIGKRSATVAINEVFGGNI